MKSLALRAGALHPRDPLSAKVMEIADDGSLPLFRAGNPSPHTSYPSHKKSVVSPPLGGRFSTLSLQHLFFNFYKPSEI